MISWDFVSSVWSFSSAEEKAEWSRSVEGEKSFQAVLGKPLKRETKGDFKKEKEFRGELIGQSYRHAIKKQPS